jgi:hypothetical protein
LRFLLRFLVAVLLPVWALALVFTFSKSPLRTSSAAAANFLLALTGTVLGVHLFFRGFQSLRRRRLIENTPRSKIRAAAMGQVEIYGKVVGPYTIISPLTLSECLMYVASLYSLETGIGQNRRKLVTETLAVPFYLEDETGRVLIDPRGAELQIESTPAEFSATEPERMRRFIGRHLGANATAAATTATECSIKPGDMLFVLGSVRENPRTVDPHSAAALQFDEFFLSPEAAELQRRCALEDIQAQPAEHEASMAVAPEFDLNPIKVLAKAPGQLLLISQFSQLDIVRELAWQCAAFIWGGPLTTVLSVGYLGHRVGWW